MSMKAGGPAFPRAGFSGEGGYGRPEAGMTLRDYFAAKALPALLECSWPDLQLKPTSGLTALENTARFAYEMADAMLKARDA